MKTRSLLFLFTLACLSLHAQDMGCIPYHDFGYELFVMENLMQQRNGDIVSHFYIAEFEYPYTNYTPLGNYIFKVSPSELQITDSLFLPNERPPYRLFAQDPGGDGNIMACIEYDADTDSSYLRIVHFPDGDLQANHDGDVVVPLCQGQTFGYYDSHSVDTRGDLILKYYQDLPDGSTKGHVARFGSDGTLKLDAVLPQNQNFLRKMEVLSNTPLTYFHRPRSSDTDLTCYILDSAFNTTDTCVIGKTIVSHNYYHDSILVASYHEYFRFNSDMQVIPDGDDLLVAGQYVCDTNSNPMTAEIGVAVARYDMQTMECENLIWFNDWTGWDKSGECLGFQKMSDGTLYLVYLERTKTPDISSAYAVRLDSDFSVKWKRHLTYFDTLNVSFNHCILGSANGKEALIIAGDSYSVNAPGTGVFYFYLNHDGTASTSEGSLEVRPYAFYPNPARDMLRMDFSPDVEPGRVDVFDLQGRLMKSQADGLGSIDIKALPAGVYMLRVSLKDGRSFSDKVVKE